MELKRAADSAGGAVREVGTTIAYFCSKRIGSDATRTRHAFQEEEVSVKKLLLLPLFFVVLGLTACNTTRGFGKDVEATGDAIEDTAEDTMDEDSDDDEDY